jgi:hypothetical protein
MVTSSSTYFEVALETPVVPSATDLAAWTAIPFPSTTEALFVTDGEGLYLGLFGYDLTNFFANCVTAGTDACNSTDYNAAYFDGWSIGAQLVVSATDNTGFDYLTLGVCLESNLGCFGLYTDYTGSGNAIQNAWNNAYTLNVEWGADVPNSGTVDSNGIDTTTASIGYGFWPSWFAAPSVYDDTATTAYFVNFLRINDFYKEEIDGTEVAITTSD